MRFDLIDNVKLCAIILILFTPNTLPASQLVCFCIFDAAQFTNAVSFYKHEQNENKKPFHSIQQTFPLWCSSNSDWQVYNVLCCYSILYSSTQSCMCYVIVCNSSQLNHWISANFIVRWKRFFFRNIFCEKDENKTVANSNFVWWSFFSPVQISWNI